MPFRGGEVFFMSDQPRFQYSLRSLLWLMTGFAILCSAVTTCPKAYRGLLWEVVDRVVVLVLGIGGVFFGTVMAIDIVSWFTKPHANADTLGKKLRLLFRSRPFWIAICVALPLAIGLNFVPYYFSIGADMYDGVATMGWPLAFYERGGIEGFVYRSIPVCCIDMLIASVSSLVAGVYFRNGVVPVLGHVRRLFYTIRTWPNHEESHRKPDDD
jgi:hypothetical protein